MEKSWYAFSAAGVCPNGMKFNCSGHVSGPPAPGNSPIPHEVFESARDEVLKCFPGATLKGERPDTTKYPAIRRLKRPPRR